MRSIWCSIPRISGSPGGIPFGKTSFYSCKRLVTVEGKVDGISSSENKVSLQTKAEQIVVLASISSISDLVAMKHDPFSLISF